MEWKFKQWWSTIPLISTNEQSTLIITHWAQIKTNDLGNPGLCVGQAQKMWLG
jgi:hypothetical protein